VEEESVIKSFLHREVPWTTAGVAFCVFATVGSFVNTQPGWAAAFAPSNFEVWSDKPWAPLTSIFLHGGWLHLVFNLFWFSLLGGAFERVNKAWQWLTFITCAQIVSYGLQLGSTGGVGKGISGPIFALFGYFAVVRMRSDSARCVVTLPMVVAFSLLLFGYSFLTILGIEHNVANVAHFAGLVFGMLWAMLFLRPKPIFEALAIALMTIAAVTMLCWAPWQVSWVSTKAQNAITANKLEEAEAMLYRSLKMGEDSGWIWERLAQVYILQNDDLKYSKAISNLRSTNKAAADRLDRFSQSQKASLALHEAYSSIQAGEWGEAEKLLRYALSMGADASLVWEYFAFIYRATKDESRYQDALMHLRDLDPKRVKEIEEESK
jgi:membrane associated rhomboid family serine protease